MSHEQAREFRYTLDTNIMKMKEQHDSFRIEFENNNVILRRYDEVMSEKASKTKVYQ